MVGDRDHSLKHHDHIDDPTLEAYVLGQLLPDEEQAIRQHIEACPFCREKVVTLRTFHLRVATDLRQELDRTHASSRLNFDPIASRWRRPPRLLSRLVMSAQVLPGVVALGLMGTLLSVLAFLFSAAGSAALSEIVVASSYDGPPAIVAAATTEGVVVVRYAPDSITVVGHFSFVSRPTRLKLAPEGRWLAFEDRQVLHVVSLDAAAYHGEFPVQDFADWSWSPDGTALAFTDGQGQMVLLDMKTLRVRVLVPASEGAWGLPVWLPDGRSVAYAQVEPLLAVGSSVQRQGVWRVDVASGFRVELARNPDPASTLLVPAAWDAAGSSLLAWDARAGIEGALPDLYGVDAVRHTVKPLGLQTPAQGTRLAWPVNERGTILALREGDLVALSLTGTVSHAIPDPISWPQDVQWSPQGAWLAYTVYGAPEGSGVYYFAPGEGVLRSIRLPAGAREQAVTWAGPEHLFVIRQPAGQSVSELWLVPLTGSGSSYRLMANISLPHAGPYNGWWWGDAVVTQTLGSAS